MKNNTPNSAFHFQDLTPDLMWHALADIGIWAESGFIALNSYENRVYQFTCEHQQKWVVKFYRPQRWTREQVLEEHDYTLALHSHGIPVIAPCILQEQSLHQYQGYFFAVYTRAGGRPFEVDNLDHLALVGSLIGQMHLIGQKAAFQHRPSIDVNALAHYREQLHQCHLIPAQYAKNFFSALDDLIESIQHHWVDSSATLRLHGDCHIGNILWDTAPILVDLDDACTGPAIQDIWMLLSGDLSEKRIQLEVLLEAYNEHLHFDTNQLKLIEPLRGLRMVHHVAWLAKRWDDPAFPIAFPWFNNASYWEQQVLLFKEQRQDLQKPTLSLTPQW